jgi:hypothetical protein
MGVIKPKESTPGVESWNKLRRTNQNHDPGVKVNVGGLEFERRTWFLGIFVII